MDLLLNALFDMLAPPGAAPRVDRVVAVVALVSGALVGAFMYARMFDNGGLGILAWILIPMAGTVLVATLLHRPHAIRGAFLSAAVALAVGLPAAVLDAMFGFWG